MVGEFIKASQCNTSHPHPLRPSPLILTLFPRNVSTLILISEVVLEYGGGWTTRNEAGYRALDLEDLVMPLTSSRRNHRYHAIKRQVITFMTNHRYYAIKRQVIT